MKIPQINNVATHITSLNRKAQAVTGKQMIFCKRGQGYYITEQERKPYIFVNAISDKILV